MDSKTVPSRLLFLLIIFLVFINIPISEGNDACDSSLFDCGSIGVGYPFWGKSRPANCGVSYMELSCSPENITTIQISSTNYKVLAINTEGRLMRIVRMDYNIGDICSWEQVSQTTLDLEPFGYTSVDVNLNLFYGCSSTSVVPTATRSQAICGLPPSNVVYYNSTRGGVESDQIEGCQTTLVFPILVTSEATLSAGASAAILTTAINSGFRVQWTVPDQKVTIRSTLNWKWKLLIAIGASSIAVITMAILLYYLRRKSSSNGLMLFWKRSTRNTQNVEVFLKNYGSLAPKRFSYRDIKKMTSFFNEKVGQGGFGGVFKGKLPDGRLVAVKVLNDSKGSGEDFINEVASIGRTCHVNIVTFQGFCVDGSKRALIYEFMSNGSLEKFIYNKKSMETCPHLGWERLHQIAVGIAKGLEYLHRGCNTRILHFDIKPHNILLDDDFCPKISDFGLAKLCPKEDSIISMADARGTIGYIAPEVFSRNFGGVSHKSDVYSYGMMILEMVGGRKNNHTGVDHTSENSSPHSIYKHIVQGEHLQLDMVQGEEEEEIAKKMVLVGLWCIQVDPTKRPSMSKVLEMLEGNLESLPIPPMPYLFSPPRQQADFST